ncbi:phosphate ABC transporter permease PstA [Halomicrococcus sp. SG-WS-1]|uniref:phosphate ABC transporter permease PstA n=1 Tax=Halomicrococcus sp. SG-WS-1 TaxID=3439057 RepID=UPI003F7A0F41
MSDVRRTRLVVEDGTVGDRLATAIVGLGLAVFVASWTTLFQWVGEETTLFGVSLFDALGLCLLAMGAGILAQGAASRYGVLPTDPVDTAGLLPGTLFGGVGVVVGGLVASQTLGLGPVGWVGGALALGAAFAAATVLPREDVGSTIPAGALLLFAGAVVVSGLLDAGWTWSPENLSVTLVGSVVVPVLAIVAALVGSWSAAKARAGFGARGRQQGAFLLVSMSVFGMLAVLGLLVAFIVVNGLETVLTGANVGNLEIPFLTNVASSLFVEVPGVLPAIVGTVWLVFIAVVFAVPLGVGAAVFLTEYAEKGRFTQLVEVATNGLWSTPSIVFGLFGLAFVLPRVSNGTKSLLGGGIVLGFMLLPLVVITSRESIKAVPDEYRDASAALGVSQWETVRSVVLPAAMPGVITGVILGVGRIAGETAPLLLTFGGQPFPSRTPDVLGSFEFTSTPPFVTNPVLLDRGSALPYQLYTSITAGHVPGDAFTTAEFGWGVALVLLVVVLGMYAIGIGSRFYFRSKLHNE